MSEARAKVTLAGGTTIEFDGTEAFVTAQLEKFGESIRAGVAGEHYTPPPDPVRDAGPAPDPLARIFAATDTGLKIVSDIPGRSNAEKTVNAAILLAHGMAKLRNRKTVFFREVKAVCRAHRCHDATNMATVLKTKLSARSAFVFGGSGQKQTLSLTDEGTKQAERLIRAM